MVKFYFRALVGIIFLLTPERSFLQNSDAPKSLGNTYFIKNCFVVQKPGIVLSGQNVLIKDGFISDISPSSKPPFDAQIIQADSMYVYAGFIDGFSNIGISKPESKDRPKLPDPGSPPNDLAGITPQNSSLDSYKSSDKSVSDMRSAGFVISNVAPRGLMLPGQCNLILLGDESADKLLLKAKTGQTFQLESNRGIYPATIIGVMAKFREIYKNASIAGNHEAKYKANPSGLMRPDFSRELMAMYPVTTQKMPLFFVTQKTKDVHKALSLKEELGFDLILTEVKQGWHYIDKIKKTNTRVLLSLDLPEIEKKKAKSETAKDSLSTKKDSVSTKELEKVEKNPEKEAFDVKKEQSIKEYLSQAALFEKQGILFGFSFLNVKPSDIKNNIRTLIENGLSEDAALAALTTNPAQILGINNVAGTVEKGKIANLIITDKPYFNEKSAVKYTFVDGRKYEYQEKKKQENKPTEAGKFIGTWTYTVEVPGSVQKGKMVITKSAGEYMIKVFDNSSPGEEDVANNISVNENSVTFNIIADMGQPVKVDFDLKFAEKAYSGSVSVGEFGTFPIKGEYESEPKLF